MNRATNVFPPHPAPSGFSPRIQGADQSPFPSRSRSLITIVMGVLSIVLGIIAWGAAAYTTLVSMYFLGAVVIVAGIVQIVEAFRSGHVGSFFMHLLIGVLDIVVGLLLLRAPFFLAASLTLLFASYFMVSGVFRIVGAATVRTRSWGWMAFSGVVSLLLGLWVFWQLPVATFYLIGAFIGIDLIFTGWAMVMLGLIGRDRTLAAAQS